MHGLLEDHYCHCKYFWWDCTGRNKVQIRNKNKFQRLLLFYEHFDDGFQLKIGAFSWAIAPPVL